jgi:predicted RNase H-like nuclease (RuvC/YqgF family)
VHTELDSHRQISEEKDAQLVLLKQMLDDFEKKFEKIRDANAKLKESIALLIPEAERSKEYEKIIEQIEKTNRELNVCVNSLKYENKNLDKKAKSLQIDLEMLKRKIDSTVDKSEYEKILKEKGVLEEKVKQLEKKLADQVKEYEKLSKDYQWLEKEYNALYKNVNENNEASQAVNQPS